MTTITPKQEPWSQDWPNEEKINPNSITLCKRIVVGTYSFPLGVNEKRKYGNMTHKWVCLLRSPDNENMTHYIRKVQFDLDPSFINPRRVLTTMPYEVNEVGWGEFFITVSIYFTDETLDPVKIVHLLKLNPPDALSDRPMCAVNETHDEIVFIDPSDQLFQKLQTSTYDITEPSIYQPYFWDSEKKARDEMCRYIYCQSYLQAETMGLMAEANNLSSQIQALQDHVNSVYYPKRENILPLKKEQLPPLTLPQHNPLDSLANLQSKSNLQSMTPGHSNTPPNNPINNNQNSNSMSIDGNN